MKSTAAQAHEDQLRSNRENPEPPDPDADPIATARQVQHMFASWSTDPGSTVTEVDADGVRSLWVDNDGASQDAVLLYFHGGAYMLGTADHVTKMVGHIGKAAGCRVLSVDYRLAPEHAFPAAVDDAITSYKWLLDQGIAADKIVLSGDSAGGGLALAALLAIKEQGLPTPAGAAPISPWADLSCSYGTWQSAADTDMLLSQDALAGIADMYLQGTDASSPQASPVHGDYTGLPPLYIQASGFETLLDDCLQVAAAAARAGVVIRLDVFPGMQHVFQYCVGNMPEADDAIARVAEWIRSAVS